MLAGSMVSRLRRGVCGGEETRGAAASAEAAMTAAGSWRIGSSKATGCRRGGAAEEDAVFGGWPRTGGQVGIRMLCLWPGR